MPIPRNTVHHRMRLAIPSLTALCLLTSLAACSSPDQPKTKNAESSTPTSTSSAYASRIRASLQYAPDELTTQILEEALKTGTIEEKDVSALIDQQTQCLADAGFTDVSIDMTGAGSYNVPPSISTTQEDDIVKECTGDWQGADNVFSLYNSMHANPQNKDVAQIIVECLVRNGLVDKDFTVNDYKSLQADGDKLMDWVDAFVNPEHSGYSADKAQQFQQCSSGIA